MGVGISGMQCYSCGRRRIPSRNKVRMCPGCKSPYWDIENN